MTPDDLRAWRSRMGLSQSQAAEALGVTPDAVKKWEAGRREISDTVALLCAALERERAA